MNIRNIQVFGFRAIKPKIKALLFIIVLFLFVGTFVLFFRGSPEEAALSESGIGTQLIPVGQESPITGAVVADVPTFVQSEVTKQSSSGESPLLSDQPAEQQPSYLEYERQCALDIKKAEDDVADIQNYLPKDEQALADAKATAEQQKNELTAKIAELEQQLTALREELSSVTTNSEASLKLLEERVALSQQNLNEAQQKLDALRNSCQKR